MGILNGKNGVSLTYSCSAVLLMLRYKIHDMGSELGEELALERFGKEVPGHFYYQTVFNRKFLVGNLVSYKEEVIINMMCMLAAGLHAIAL